VGISGLGKWRDLKGKGYVWLRLGRRQERRLGEDGKKMG
jgi:hypothetical protein